MAARAKAIVSYYPELLSRPSGYTELLASGLVKDALAVQGIGDVTPNPNAELKTLCKRFLHLEWQRRSFFSGDCNPIEDEDERDLALEPIDAEQDTIVTRLVALPPKTLEGAALLAQSAMLWHPYTLEEQEAAGKDGQLIAALLRGLAPDMAVEVERIAQAPREAQP
jgi:hypothetical protein